MVDQRSLLPPASVYKIKRCHISENSRESIKSCILDLIYCGQQSHSDVGRYVITLVTMYFQRINRHARGLAEPFLNTSRETACSTQNYWRFGTCPLSGILKGREHDVSETGSVSDLR
jgi:hypothetical protein